MLPKGIKSTGFPSVRETCRKIGIEFDEWQQDLNRCLLAKDAHGVYAADTAVLSIARQVGKTYNVGAVAFAKCIAIPGLTVVWTAHRFKVSRESFNEMRSWAKRPELVPHIDYVAITSGAGNECIPFRNGSRIVFAARERGAIRGFTKVGMLVLDEAQILSEAALSDLVPTTNQAPNPLVVLMGTPPKPNDPSEVFTRLRDEALNGESDDILYVELSAERDCDPSDRAAWRVANPSYPKRTPAKAILRMRKLLSSDDFLREGLGIWDDVANQWLIIPEAAWSVAADPFSRPLDPVVFAADATPDQGWGSIAVAGRRGDDLMHVEVIEHRPDTAWIPSRLVELRKSHRTAAIVIDPKRQASPFIAELEDAGVEVEKPTAREMAQACGAFYTSVMDKKSLRYNGAPPLVGVLNTALAGATKRILEGAWAWDGRTGLDISPLVAVTLAAWGHAKRGNQPAPEMFFF